VNAQKSSLLKKGFAISKAGRRELAKPIPVRVTKTTTIEWFLLFLAHIEPFSEYF
jgi:hypothetical protein